MENSNEKRFVLLHMMHTGIHAIVETLMDEAVPRPELPLLMPFRSRPSLAAHEFEKEHEWIAGEGPEFLDKMCTEGLLSKSKEVYSVTPALQDYFAQLDRAERKAFEIIFKGVSEPEGALLDDVATRVVTNCFDYIEQHPELFPDDDTDDDKGTCADDRVSF